MHRCLGPGICARAQPHTAVNSPAPRWALSAAESGLPAPSQVRRTECGDIEDDETTKGKHHDGPPHGPTLECAETAVPRVTVDPTCRHRLQHPQLPGTHSDVAISGRPTPDHVRGIPRRSLAKPTVGNGSGAAPPFSPRASVRPDGHSARLSWTPRGQSDEARGPDSPTVLTVSHGLDGQPWSHGRSADASGTSELPAHPSSRRDRPQPSPR